MTKNINGTMKQLLKKNNVWASHIQISSNVISNKNVLHDSFNNQVVQYLSSTQTNVAKFNNKFDTYLQIYCEFIKTFLATNLKKQINGKTESKENHP